MYNLIDTLTVSQHEFKLYNLTSNTRFTLLGRTRLYLNFLLVKLYNIKLH